MEWHAYFNSHGDPSVVTDLDRPSFTKVCDVSTGSDDYGLSNTFLIAASPRLLAVIQGALRIESLWRPFLSEPISPQHSEECKALNLMYEQFVEAVKLATEPT